MAKKSMILKAQREPKFSSRRNTRCKICGRPHAYLLPGAGLQGPDPRREEGFLVIGNAEPSRTARMDGREDERRGAQRPADQSESEGSRAS